MSESGNGSIAIAWSNTSFLNYFFKSAQFFYLSLFLLLLSLLFPQFCICFKNTLESFVLLLNYGPVCPALSVSISVLLSSSSLCPSFCFSLSLSMSHDFPGRFLPPVCIFFLSLRSCFSSQSMYPRGSNARSEADSFFFLCRPQNLKKWDEIPIKYLGLKSQNMIIFYLDKIQGCQKAQDPLFYLSFQYYKNTFSWLHQRSAPSSTKLSLFFHPLIFFSFFIKLLKSQFFFRSRFKKVVIV